MKLRRFIAALLVLTLLILDSPLKLIDIAWAADETTTIKANDTTNILRSASMKDSQEGNLGCQSQENVRTDKPTIATLRSAVIGQFNASGSE